MLPQKPRIPVSTILLYGLWPGFIKILLYRLKGYKIGKGVTIGFGAVISGDRVDVGDYTSIGFFTVIRGKEIKLGPYVQIGSTTFLDTPYLDIGEGTKVNEQVFVGGLQFPDSKLVVGKNCQIMQMSFINPARSIVIGDDSGIGGHCLIFGHSSFHNQFEGYPVECAPIVIGNSVGLAWRVFVLPGTNIGDGVMVGANSVVSGTIPPKSLAVGFPARIVGRPPVFPRQVTCEQKIEMFRSMVAEMLQFFAGSGLVWEQREGVIEIRRDGKNLFWKKRVWRMSVIDNDPRQAYHGTTSKLDLLLSLFEIPDDLRTELANAGVMWIDVASKQQSRVTTDLGAEVSLLLRRYGVRTLRCGDQ